MKTLKIILLVLSFIFTAESIFAFCATCFGTDIFGTKFINYVFYNESETTFNNDNTISIVLVNETGKDFNDETIRLNCLDYDDIQTSEQICISILAGERKEIKFNSTNLTQFKNKIDKIKVCVLEENGTWTALKTGKNFMNEEKIIKTIQLASVIALSIFVICDILLIHSIKQKNKNNSF